MKYIVLCTILLLYISGCSPRPSGSGYSTSSNSNWSSSYISCYPSNCNYDQELTTENNEERKAAKGRR